MMEVEELDFKEIFKRIATPTTIPLTVENINDFLDVMATIHKWKIQTPTIRTTILAQAGTTTEAQVNIPPGMACTRSHPLIILSDYYDKDIVVHVFVDSEENDLSYGGLPLTDKIVLSMGKFFLKRNYLKFKIINNTTTDANVTVQFPCHMVSRRVVDYIFIELLRAACRDICRYIGVDPRKVEE